MKGYSTFPLFLALLLFSCATQAPLVEQAGPASIPPKELQESSYDSLTIIATGDNLYHNVMIHEGEEGNYEKAYLEIRTLAKAADIAFINQETLLAGEDFGFTGYPLFNSPQQLGWSVSLSGFNVVNHATNHIMDKGEKAVFATMDFWDFIPNVTVLGIHRTEEERSLPVLIRKNNITVGFLSYTYGTNGIPLPKDKPYLVSLASTEIMAKEIDNLRPLCDFLAVSMHWGEEYQHDYSTNQKNLAVFLAQHGVDLVIGHHPHVIQSVEYIERPDGKTMLCYYSLGNLLSAQTRLATMLGAMAYIKITKKRGSEGAVSIAQAGAVPLVTHYERNFTEFKVFPLYLYTEELAERHMLSQRNSELNLSYLKDLSYKIFGEMELTGSPFDTGSFTH